MSHCTPRVVPDPEDDFEGCLDALAANVLEEMNREFPPELASMERTRKLLLRCMGRLTTFLDGDWRPPFMIDREMVLLVELIGTYSQLRECDPDNTNPLDAYHRPPSRH